MPPLFPPAPVRRSPWLGAVQPVVVMFVCIAAILAAGLLVFHVASDRLTESVQSDLGAVASLRAMQIESYLAERNGDARVFAGSDAVRSLLLTGVTRKPASPETIASLYRLAEYSSQGRGRYVRILVFDERGLVQWIFGDGEDVHERVAAAAGAALSADAPGLVDMHLRQTRSGGMLAFGVAMPVPRGVLPGDGPLGTVYLEMVPELVLLPMIEGWPTPSDSAETLLVRLDGERIRYLSRLRHRIGAPLGFSLPITFPNLLAALAVQSEEGVFTGVDYRGVESIGATRMVRATPWWAIAKMDLAEANAALSRLGLAIATLVAVLIVIALLFARQFWRIASMELSLSAQVAELERGRIAERYAILSREASDAILLFGPDLRVIEANDRAAACYGYAPGEIPGLHASDLRAQAEQAGLDAVREELERRGSVMQRTLHRRKDGSVFPVEVNARRILVDGRPHYLVVVRDRTEAETAHSRFEQAIGTAVDGFAELSADLRFLAVNQAMCELTGYSESELRSMTVRDLDVLESDAELDAHRIAVQAGGRRRFDTRWKRKDGKLIDIGASVSEPLEEGRTCVFLRDITERKAAEHALFETTRKLELAEEVAQVGAYALYPGEDRWESSPVLEGIYGIDSGYPRTEESWLRPVSEEYRDRAAALWRGHALMTGDFDAEYPIRRVNDGALRWVQTRARVEARGAGAPVRIVGATHDLTLRHMAEERVRTSEERLARILESSPLPIQVLDADDATTRYINTAHRGFFGYALEDIRAAEDWFGKVYAGPGFAREIRARWQADVARVRAGDVEAARSPELRMRVKDGSERRVQGHMTLVGDEAVIVWSDLTERLRMEDELRDSEGRFRALVEQSMTGMFVIEEGRLVYANPRFAELLGRTTEQVVGMRSEDFVLAEDIPVILAFHERLKAGDKTVSFTVRARRADGSIATFGVNGVAAMFAGRPAVIALAQDITERRRAEERIAAYANQLEESMFGTVGAIASMVDLRDPYTSGHEKRVAAIAVAIGRELGMGEHACKGLELMGTVHDIGKIAVPAEILSKPTRLTPIEYEMIKGHAQAGYEILKDVKFPWPLADAIRQHHERMDGSGYPQGLKGGEILIEARILAVADVVESMSSHRPYRPALGLEAGLDEIGKNRGTQFDAAVVDAMLRLVREKGYVIPE